jgi:hypothetical protein
MCAGDFDIFQKRLVISDGNMERSFLNHSPQFQLLHIVKVWLAAIAGAESEAAMGYEVTDVIPGNSRGEDVSD